MASTSWLLLHRRGLGTGWSTWSLCDCAISECASHVDCSGSGGWWGFVGRGECFKASTSRQR